MDELTKTLTAIQMYGPGAKLAAAHRSHGLTNAVDHFGALPSADQERIAAESESLRQRGVSVVTLGDDAYPKQLAGAHRPPTFLFVWGDLSLLHHAGIGMCGSRNVSGAGLSAARACGEEVASRSLTVISGYAKGVDTETHLAALRLGGRTVMVLAEGISHFRVKKDFAGVGIDPEKVAVVSQFAPRARWSVGAAMTRNGVIAGLGRALVVVEAGATGGTLDAGMLALDAGLPVFALQFTSMATPEGNSMLLTKGAVPITSRQHLGRELDRIQGQPLSALVADGLPPDEQLRLGF